MGMAPQAQIFDYLVVELFGKYLEVWLHQKMYVSGDGF